MKTKTRSILAAAKVTKKMSPSSRKLTATRTKRLRKAGRVGTDIYLRRIANSKRAMQ